MPSLAAMRSISQRSWIVETSCRKPAVSSPNKICARTCGGEPFSAALLKPKSVRQPTALNVKPAMVLFGIKLEFVWLVGAR
jgi:hypothetical protein